MKGNLNKTQQGWVVNYEDITSLVPFTQKGYKQIPLHSDNATYCLDADQGKEIEFEIVISALDFVGYAKLIGSEARKQTLAYLANQAQELNLGYEPEWSEFFQESEKVLNFELPIRYKNWLKNTFKKPQKNN